MIGGLSTRWLLMALVCIGLAARIGLAVKLGLNDPPESDSYEFDNYAWNLAQGRGYRGISPDVTDTDHLTAYRVPGTSLVWAGLYKVFGHRYDVVRTANCVIGAATILLVYGIGRRCFSESVGLLSAAIFTVYPLALLYSTELFSEALATFVFLWYVLACLQFAAKPTATRAVWAGLLLGFSLLTRASAVLMLPLAVVWAIWQFRKQRRAMALAAVIPVIAVATLVPWVARNYRVFRKFIPLSTQGGSALLQGNNDIVATDPKYYGYSVWDTKINDEITRQLKAPNDEYERDKVAGRLAVQWLKDNPGKWWYLIQAKFRRAFTPFLQPTSPKLYRIGMLLSWGPVLVLFTLAFFPTLIAFLREQNPGRLIHLAISHYVANSLIFFALSRYRFSIEPLCIVLACAALVWAHRRIPRPEATT